MKSVFRQSIFAFASSILFLIFSAPAAKVWAQAPTISSFTPASGNPGTLVTITGTNLGTPTAFTIGGTAAIVVSNTGTSLVGMVMPGSATGSVSITTSGGTATGSGTFSVTTTPFPSVQQGSKLVGTGATGAALQGISVAMSADGNTAIVGGYSDNTNVGAVWIYTRSGGSWTQQGTKLVGTGAVGGSSQGSSVALSADGNTALVGGRGDNTNAGAAWVFTRSGTTWSQQGTKLVGTGAVGAALQGFSVSLSADGNTAMVGGCGDNSNAGAAWVYTRSGTTWTQQGAKLVGTGAVGAAYQGWSVALSANGTTAMVGASQDNAQAGAAWVYTRSGTTWTQQGTKLVGTGAAGAAQQGMSVSLSADGNTGSVGGYGDNSEVGAAWVYTRSGTTWTQQGTKLVGTGAVGGSTQGVSVSLSADGNTAFIGGYNDNSFAGANWIFTRSGSTWTQQGSKLIGTSAMGTAARQGAWVAMSADGRTAISGAFGDNANAGAAWVYVVSNTITYDGNANTGGTVPAVTTGANASAVTLATNSGSLVKTGYSFAGWNTLANGTGTSYAAGASYTLAGNVTLYAKWTANNYTITFNGNGSTAGTMANQTIAADASANLTANAFTRTGFTFIGWGTTTTSGVAYDNLAGYTMGAANVTLYAQWAANNTITFNGNGSTAGTMAAQTITSGLSANLTANAFTRTGFTFIGWGTTTTGGVVYTNSASYTMGASSVTLYAQWAANFTVTFNGNGSTAGTMAAQTIGSGLSANLTANAFTRTSNTFIGWNTATDGSGDAYANSASYTMGNANVTLYAQWASNFTVTFNGNGSTAGTMAAQTIASGLSANLTANAFTRTGFTFIGWGTTTTGGVVYTNSASYTMGSANVTLYAQWASNFTVTFNGNGSTAGTMAAQTIASGLSANLTANAFTRTGFTFMGWGTTTTGGVVYTNSASYTMGSANVTLYAQWASNFTITFNGNGSTAGTMAAQTIGSGLSANLTANAFTRTGFTFIGWGTTTTGGVVYTNSASYTMGASNVTLYAQWASNFTVTFNGNGSTAGTMAAQTIGSGLSAPLTTNAFTRTGFSFAGWNTATNGSGNAYANLDVYTMGTANVTLYAQWTSSYSITFNANGGTGTMAAQTIGSGLSANLTANAFTRTGYVFAGWGSTPTIGVEYANSDNYNMGVSNVTLYAQWAKTITFHANGGTGTMASQTIVSGIANTLNSNTFTRTGYTVVGWGTSPTSGVVYGNNALYTMGAANVTLYAQWTANNYTITFNANGGTGTMANQTIATNASANLTANAFTRTGYVFAGWGTTTTSGVVYTDGFSYTMDTSNTTLYAQWANVPDAPTGLTATPRINRVSLSFTAPGNDGGTAITNYAYSTDNGASWTAVSPASTATEIVISGLTNCTAYNILVQAVNSIGAGSPSTAVLVTPRTGVGAGTNWTIRTSAADNDWQSVTYGNGVFVAVANTGTGNRVMTSPDGINWTIRNSAADIPWISVTYGNGLFVAVATNNVMTSPDGITWTLRSSPLNSWFSVTYGNGLFVAVASSGTGNRVMTSPDGITWTSRTSAADNFWTSITYGNGLFVAVAQSGTGNRVMTSPDGINWTIRTSAVDNPWFGVTYGNGLFVAVAQSGTGNRVMTSTNGITWTIRNSAADNQWYSVSYGNGLFVAVSRDGIGNRVMTSPDGITWTIRTSAADNSWMGVSYGNGLFVVVAASGTGNRVMTSPGFDALVLPDMPAMTGISPVGDYASVAFTAPASVGGSAISNYEYSINGGSSWVTRSPAATTSPLLITGLTPLTTYPVQLRAVNTQGSGCASATTNTTTAAVTVPNAPTGLTAVPGINLVSLSFTAPTNNGGGLITNYQYSTDNGASWTAVSPASTGTFIVISGLSNCTEYNTMVRAVNSAGASAPSTAVLAKPRAGDGVAAGTNWTIRTSAANNNWYSVTYGNGLFVAVATTGTGNRVMTSPDGINWTIQTSAAGNTWNSVTYGNGLFVAVAGSGTGNRVMTSPDGIIWASQTSAANNNWSSVTYGNGLFVAVAGSGTGNRVMTSPDGINWTIQTSAADNNWTSVTYGNGLFVAVATTGTGNRVMTSPDGITWTIRTSAADNNWTSVTYGNGLFVAVSQSGTGNRVMTSPDGINWTGQTSAADNNWTSVTYGNGLFVAVAGSGTGNRVMTSPDGINWTIRNSAANNNWYSVTYGNGLFVAVAWSGTGNRVMTSSQLLVPDRPVITGIIPSGEYASMAFTAPASVGGSAISNYEYSINGGSSWVTRSPASTTSPLFITGLTPLTSYPMQLRAVNAQGSGCASATTNTTTPATTVPAAPTGLTATPSISRVFLSFTAPGNDGGGFITNYQYSTDNGASWTALSPASTATEIIITGLSNCTEYKTMVRAVNSAGAGAPSTAVSVTPRTGVGAGTNWTSRTSAADNNWTSVTYGNGLYVAVASSGTGNRVMTSPDGISWTLQTSASNNLWYGVTYGNGLFVAVAYGGTGNRAMTSPDGINWTLRASPTDVPWYSVTYGNGLFVAVSYAGITTSPDGITWTLRTPPAYNNWNSVTYGNGLFVAVSSDGTGNRVMTSPDGITWTSRTSAADNSWQSVTYGNGLFVAVAFSGTGNRVMTSPDGINWTSRTSAADNFWTRVTYGNGLFVAVALSGTGNRVMTSPDGITWTIRSSSADNDWFGVTYGNGLFVSVANSGTGNRVMTSSGFDAVVPESPVISSITPSYTSIDVAFTAPASVGGSAISNYEYSINGGSSWVTRSPASTTSPLTITGLTEVTAYPVQLRAVNTQGSGCASATLNTTTLSSALTVTYDSQGGSAISNGSTTTGASIATSPGTPTRAGYTFNGWFAAATGGTAISFPYAHGQTANFTLYAQWALNLTITYNSQGGSAIANGSTTTGASISASPGTPTRAGYTFNGWFVAATGGTAISFPYAHGQTADFMLYAQWLLIPPPTITSISPPSGLTVPGATVTITGTNFNTTAANNIVRFGAVQANVSAASATSLTVTAPVGATYAPVTTLNTALALAATSPIPFLPTFAGKGNLTASDILPNVDFTSGNASLFVAIGDLDGDGKPDLAVANYAANTVSVFRNTSVSGSLTASSFATKVDFATGVFPRSLAIGDLDGDGKPDLAVANDGSTSVSVFRNTSVSGSITASSFAAKVDFTVVGVPWSVAISDLDGDGKPDLAVANQSSNSVSVFRNTSVSGSITASSFAARVDFSTGIFPRSLAIGDLDGDGKPDLAVANNTSNSVSVYLNTSVSGSITASSFAAKVDFATEPNPEGIAIGDLDEDGKPDLAVANSGSASVSVFRNTSVSGSITASSFAAKVNFATGASPFSVSIGDLDGDGKPDLAVANNTSNSVSVFRNTSASGSITASSFAAKVDYTASTNPRSVAIGDLDGDGKPDLAVANRSSSSVSVFRNNPSGLISFNANGGTGTIANQQIFYLASANLTANAFTRTGYTFAGWNTAADGLGTAYANLASYTMGASDVTLYAQWAGNTLMVTYESQGGSSISNASTTSGASIAVSPGTPTRAGYTFMGWFAAATGGTAISFPYAHGQTADFTLYAQWTANTLTITYDSQGGSAISNGSTTTDASIAASPGTPTRTGYTFNGWFAAATGGTAVSFPYTHGQTANFTLYVQWTINDYTVTFNGNGADGGSMSAQTITYNATAGLTANGFTRTGFGFVGWATSAGGVVVYSDGASYTMGASNVNLYAKWVANPTIISFTPVSAPSGAVVVISGSNFSNASAVSFGSDAAASFSVINASTIQATLASGASGSVSVTTPGGTASLAGFVYCPVMDTPDVTLSSDSGTAICAGTTVVFTAQANNTGGGTVVYTFKVNGITVQSGSSDTWTSATLTNGKTVTCSISISGGLCLSTITAASNSLTMAVSPKPTWYLDADNDDHYTGTGITQCYSPGAGYRSSGLLGGNDCDDADNTVWRTGNFYTDADGDNYTLGAVQSLCYGASTPIGYSTSTLGTDCDDADNSKWRTVNRYTDADGDGYGTGSLQTVCYGLTIPSGYVTNDTDCDDADNSIWHTSNFYTDADGDNYTVGAVQSLCYGASTPSGYSATSLGTDCDDSNPGLTANCTSYTWTGASSGDWNNASNWNSNVVPGGGTDVVIPAGTTNTISTGGTFNCHSATIQAGATVSISSGGVWNIGGNLQGAAGAVISGAGKVVLNGSSSQTISGTVSVSNLLIGNNAVQIATGSSLSILPTASNPNALLTLLPASSITNNGNLILRSNSFGTGSIGPVPVGATITGNITQERLMPSSNGWYFVGAPVKSSTRTEWSELNARISPKLNATLFEYSESDSSTGEANEVFGWKVPNTLATAINPGNEPKGYRMYLGQTNPTRLASVTGLPFVQDVNKVLSYSPTTGYAGGGWNLISNPYPCAIDWNQLRNDGENIGLSLSNAYYTFNGAAGNYGTYTSLNASTGVGVGGLQENIASSQAFFVKANGAGNLAFKESFKNTAANSASFLRTATSELEFLKFKVQQGSNWDEAGVLFFPEAAEGLDNYDALNLTGSAVDVATVMADGKNAAIEVLPQVGEQRILPLKVQTPANGAASFRFGGMENFPSTIGMYLKDDFLGSLTDIRQNPEISFEEIPNQTYNRFSLILATEVLTSKGGVIQKKTLRIFPNPTQTSATVLSPKSGEMELFNAMGQKVKTQTILIGQSRLDVSGLPKGMYWIRLEGMAEEKLIVE